MEKDHSKRRTKNVVIGIIGLRLIVKILSLYFSLLCTQLYHFFPVSIQYLQSIRFLDQILKEFILRSINTEYFLKIRVMFMYESTLNMRDSNILQDNYRTCYELGCMSFGNTLCSKFNTFKLVLIERMPIIIYLISHILQVFHLVTQQIKGHLMPLHKNIFINM